MLYKSSMFIVVLSFLTCSCTSKSTDSESEQLKEYQYAMITYNQDTLKTIQLDTIEWILSDLNVTVSNSWCLEETNGDCSVGRLYNFKSAKEACNRLGIGWDVPSIHNWLDLATEFGGYVDFMTEEIYGNPKVANSYLIEGGKSLFNSKLNGWRGSLGGFSDQNRVGFYWSSSEVGYEQGYFMVFYPEGGRLMKRQVSQEIGMSCRCVRRLTL